MKKGLSNILVILLVLILISGCAGVAGKDGQDGVNGKDGINGLNGTDGMDGTNGEDGVRGSNGLSGKNGADGITPFIGSNGNWWIGNVDTNVKAAGEIPGFVFKTVTLKENLIGAVQKGPFTSGTTVNIYELNQSFIQTGFSYNAMTTDNVGSFSLPKGLELSSNNLLFVAQGFYYNEVTGKNSEVPLTLSLLSDITDQTKVNINLLTSLEKQRVMFLIEMGASYSEASARARKEILDIFYISKEDISRSQDLDITQEGEDNAILLAISVILQGYRTTSELSLLLSEIGNDIKEDGRLNSERLRSELINDAVLIDLDKVRENLETFYYNNNITVSVPNFELYVNQFILKNSASNNPYEFTKFITYPTMGEHGVNLLDKNLIELSTMDDQTMYSVAATLPIGTRLKVVFTSITVENKVDNTFTLNSSRWAVSTTFLFKAEDVPVNSGADGGNALYTTVYNSNGEYGNLDIESKVYFYSNEGDHDMFKVEYFENGSETPTFTKIMRWVDPQ